MHRVKNSRMILNCGLCNLPGGCVQCSMKNCFQGFHPLCARSAGLVRLYPDKEDMHSPPIFFCAEHSAPAFALGVQGCGYAAPLACRQFPTSRHGQSRYRRPTAVAEDAMDNETHGGTRHEVRGSKVELRRRSSEAVAPICPFLRAHGSG